MTQQLKTRLEREGQKLAWWYRLALVLNVLVICLALVMLIALAFMLLEPQPQVKAAECFTARITAYVATGSRTANGEIPQPWVTAAASDWIPFNSYVEVEGLGTFRINDRGHLGSRHIDVFVNTVREAYNVTSYREVCVYMPE